MKRVGIKEKWNQMPLTVKVSVSYAICSILQKCLNIITLPLFTRLLTTEQYGQATVYTSWLSLLVIFLTLQLPYGSFSRAMVIFEDRRNEYIASVEGICLLLSTLFLIIYLPFDNIWNRLFELPTGIMIIMVIEILASTGVALWSGKKRFEFKYKEVITYTLITSIMTPVTQYVFVVNLTEKGYARIIGGALVTILAGGTIFISSVLRGKRIFNKEFWKYAFGFNIPLLAYYLSQMVFNTSDRIMISHLSGTDMAAIYGVAYSLAIMLNFVLSAINNSYVPWFYGKMKAKRQKDNIPVANAISALMAVLLLTVIWFAPEIIYIMAGEAYADAEWIVPPVAMSTLLLFYSQLSINVEFFFEKKKTLVNASIGAAFINVVLNAALIPVYGYYAAGYTTLISYLVFAFANYLAMKKIVEEKKLSTHGYDIKRLMIILISFMALGFIGMAIYNYLLIRAVVAAVMIIILFVNKKKILSYWRLIRGGD